MKKIITAIIITLTLIFIFGSQKAEAGTALTEKEGICLECAKQVTRIAMMRFANLSKQKVLKIINTGYSGDKAKAYIMIANRVYNRPRYIKVTDAIMNSVELSVGFYHGCMELDHLN